MATQTLGTVNNVVPVDPFAGIDDGASGGREEFLATAQATYEGATILAGAVRSRKTKAGGPGKPKPALRIIDPDGNATTPRGPAVRWFYQNVLAHCLAFEAVKADWS